MTKIILASSSKYRKSLLQRLGINFVCHAPNVIESEFKSQFTNPRELATALALAKAQDIAKDNHDAIVIGGDQVASFEGEILGKPKTFQNAFNQLSKFNGKTHELITSICIIHGSIRHDIQDITKLTMRNLSDKQIREYLQVDEPLDCAGSYKLERLGIALFSKIETNDSSAIEGIPLMAVSDYLFNKIDDGFWKT
jgi:septum formation protein